jgi:hypothetical protein
MFVGSMMIPEPIMFTATMNVSWSRVIFFCCIGNLVPLDIGAALLLPPGADARRNAKTLGV